MGVEYSYNRAGWCGVFSRENSGRMNVEHNLYLSVNFRDVSMSLLRVCCGE